MSATANEIHEGTRCRFDAPAMSGEHDGQECVVVWLDPRPWAAGSVTVQFNDGATRDTHIRDLTTL